jgi:methyl-accepting chemotaxis protein
MKIRNRLIVKIVGLTSVIFLIMTSVLNVVFFAGIYNSSVSSVKTSLANRLEKEANAIYGNIFSKIEVLTEEYATPLNQIPLEATAQLEQVSLVFVKANNLIAGGGYWLEYNTIKNRKYFGPY